ncbi:MAG: hypothetical protein AAB649_07435, partial [Patescibacteria group bacterium]
GCANLVSKNYYIFNKPYSKEGYLKKLVELGLGSRTELQLAHDAFYQDVYLQAIHRYANIIGSRDVTGDNVNNSKNCHLCFDILRNVEDCKFLQGSLEVRDNYDGSGQYKHELSYENVDNDEGNRNIGTLTVYNSSNVRYSFNCHGSSYLFGCTGLRSKHYCILNKQYTKEKYEKLLPEIIEHMNSLPYTDKKGCVYKFGEFFPSELSPWAYNETIAQEYFTLTKAQVVQEGLTWKEPEGRNYKITKSAADVPDVIQDVPETITQEIIGCAHEGKCNEQCITAFRIMPQELQFYKNLNIPIPTLCPNCRHYQRLKRRNPLKLWHRECLCSGFKSKNGAYKNTAQHFHGSDTCPNEFETPYTPDGKEIIYCEQCYQAEVV